MPSAHLPRRLSRACRDAVGNSTFSAACYAVPFLKGGRLRDVSTVACVRRRPLPHRQPRLRLESAVLSCRSHLCSSIAICLTLGIWLGHPGGALIAAGGAFTVGFGARQHLDESRLLPMILASLGIAAATFIGMILGRTNFILVLVTGGVGPPMECFPCASRASVG